MTPDTPPITDAADMMDRRRRLLGPAYRHFYDTPFHPVRGQGVWLYDSEGRAHLDAYNNVVPAGHCHPRILAALTDQAARLNTHTRYLGEGILRCAEALLAEFPGLDAQVMFTCSGSEANDLAIQIARAHSGSEGLIVTANAYHGTSAAVRAASPSLMPVTAPHVRTIPLPRDVPPASRAAELGRAARAAVDDLRAHGIAPAAILFDTALSSDGLWLDPPGLLNEAVAAVRAAGGLFIADEVQAGFGRMGHMWGHQRHGLTPDIVTLGKPMGNGHPVAATVARADLIAAFAAGSRYFNTFGGNPVSCAAAMAVLEVLRDEGLIANATRVGTHLAQGLRALAGRHDCIGALRGDGLYHAVQISAADGGPGGARAARVVNAMRARRVLIGVTGPAGDVLKIRPPLIFDTGHADHLVEVLDRCLAETT